MPIKLSIMITCYNLECEIDNSIKSVIEMEMPFEWELLIGDDGSSDATVLHIQKWIDRYPHNIFLYVMERSGELKKDGSRAAKNRANLLEHAKGEYLIFLDGDDIFLGTEKLRKQVEILDDPTFKQCSCVAHNSYAYDLSTKMKRPLTSERMKDGIVEADEYLRKMYFHPNTIMFRSICKEMMLMPEYKRFLNDNFITFLILQFGSIYYLHDIWAQYNLNGNGLWTGRSKIYGNFRNIILLDLEQSINSDLRGSVFYRFVSSIRVVFKNYTLQEKDEISPLVKELSDPPFHYSLLCYKSLDKISFLERFELLFLRLKVEGIEFVKWLNNKLEALKR